MKRISILFAALMLAASSILTLSACGGDTNENVVRVYSWGDYIDEETIYMFEEETGIKVIYDTFETNEEMYPKIAAGGVDYDVICPSDYMIEKMLDNNLLQEINYDNIPNISNIDASVLEMATAYDPDNKYSVPYTYGTLGIIYNKALIDDEITSWSDLWNEEYSGNILMYNSPRDLFTAPLKMLGYSINSTDEAELRKATDLLLEQKPLVQRYVMDQIKDSLISESAAIAMAYSGEVLALQEKNPNLEYIIPEEGTNYFIDAWVIPTCAENKENAEAWIDFLSRPDIAFINFEYVTYATPNTGAQALMDESLKDNQALFPSSEVMSNCEVFRTLGEEGDQMYSDLWMEIKNASVK